VGKHETWKMKKNSAVQPSFETATDTISDEEKVGRQRSMRSGAMLRFFASRGAYTRSFCKLTGDATVCEEHEVDSTLRKLLKQQP